MEKSCLAPAKKTNNQALFGGSILKVEAAIQLAHDLDETCMQCVCQCIGVGLLGVLLDLPERV